MVNPTNDNIGGVDLTFVAVFGSVMPQAWPAHRIDIG